MIEPPPNLPSDAIVARVRERYRIDVETATFLPVGNDSTAWSFRMDGSSARWFLKVLGRTIDPGVAETPRFLEAHGIDHLIPSLATVDGDGFDAGEPYGLMLFPFIEARPGGEVGLTVAHREALGRFLRRVHDTPPDDRLRTRLRRERFDVRDEAYIERADTDRNGRSPSDAIGAAMVTAWREHRDDIVHSLRRARALSADGRSRPHELVICHADFHAWNVLVEPSGAWHVVDWDEVVFAPRERDLMFVSGDVADIDPTGEHFFAGYGGVAIDRALIAYYRYDWVLQEVADYHRRVFDASLGEATRAEALASFVELFGPEDVVAAARRADVT